MTIHIEEKGTTGTGKSSSVTGRSGIYAGVSTNAGTIEERKEKMKNHARQLVGECHVNNFSYQGNSGGECYCKIFRNGMMQPKGLLKPEKINELCEYALDETVYVHDSGGPVSEERYACFAEKKPEK